jgi:uncharacterized protein (TIGR03086 family)
MPILDLGPAANVMAKLIEGLRDDQLGAPTPCPAYTLGDLVDHVRGLAIAFSRAASKTSADGDGRPIPDASNLPADWRSRIPRDLEALAEAWRDPQAWTGMTRVGGVDLPGEVAGVVGLDELVIHGWDVATASGQPFECEPHLLQAVHDFLAASADPKARENSPFGPVVPVPDHAPLVDRVVGLSGRDPGAFAR